ncbi:MAG: hypothetical protein MZV70_37300 [Desulfobacterales bacterium]|nr:hypothetical protein [Desulfobacterales bacterium]
MAPRGHRRVRAAQPEGEGARRVQAARAAQPLLRLERREDPAADPGHPEHGLPARHRALARGGRERGRGGRAARRPRRARLHPLERQLPGLGRRPDPRHRAPGRVPRDRVLAATARLPGVADAGRVPVPRGKGRGRGGELRVDPRALRRGRGTGHSRHHRDRAPGRGHRQRAPRARAAAGKALMAAPIRMPDLGTVESEVTIARWLKAAGRQRWPRASRCSRSRPTRA